MDSPEPGDVVLMSSFTSIHNGGKLRVTYKSPDRNTVSVFMLLGMEAKDGAKPLDIVARMAVFGWVPTPELKKQLEEANVHRAKI